MNSTPVQSIRRIAPILPVRSVEAAIAHYRQLGFTVECYEDADAKEAYYAFVSLGEAELHLSLAVDLDPMTTRSACYLYVADADAMYERWSAAGIAGKLHAPEDTPYGLREFAHIDPDGNLLRIGSPLDSA